MRKKFYSEEPGCLLQPGSLKKRFRKNSLDGQRQIDYTVFVTGLSPNGKATDSDSVIVKVRILLAQR